MNNFEQIRPLKDFKTNKPFKIYRNLNKKRWFSIIGYHKEKKSYCLYAHARNFGAKDVTFKISEAGRQRAIRDQKRNVHAFALSVTLDFNKVDTVYQRENKVSYNPFKTSSFYLKNTGEPINNAENVYFSENEIFIF